MSETNKVDSVVAAIDAAGLKLRPYITLLLVACVVVLGKMWLDAHDAVVRAEQDLRQLRSAAADLVRENERIKQDTQAKLAEQKKEFTAAATPEQQVRVITKYIPVTMDIRAPAGIPLGPIDQPGASQPAEVVLPDAPSQLPKLAEYVQQAEACKVNLAGCEQQLEVTGEQSANLEQQLDVVSREKGGGFRARAKWFGWGAAAGAVIGFAATR